MNSLRCVGALCALTAWLALGAHPVRAQVEVTEASITELQEAMVAGRMTSVEITAAYLARIEAYDQQGAGLNAMIRVNPNAMAEAEALDRERALRGPRGPLHGIPVILKDNYDLAGMPSTAGSLGLAGLMPPDDAFQVEKLRAAGAVFIGKANLHELASGISTIASLGGQTLNPYDLTRNPGGSSGGTGAAIAASFAAIGWGSDTCGSIRIPSSHNNLVGLRPTKGLSSIDGIIPLSHTQDTGGPLARSVRDLAIGLDATVGPDPADPATAVLEGREPPSFVAALDTAALEGARVGIVEQLFGTTSEEQEANRLVRAAIERMVALGADTVTVEIEGLDSLLSGSSVIVQEMTHDLADYLSGVPLPPADSLGTLIDRGVVHESLAARLRVRNSTARDEDDYRTRLARQGQLRETIVALMDSLRLDAMVYPTMRRIPAVVTDPQVGSGCQLAAHSGLPALSVPAGFTNEELPMGIEFVGRPFDDARLVSLGYAFERHTDHRRRPPTTPELMAGHAPTPVSFDVRATGAGPDEARVHLVFDPVRGTLTFDLNVVGIAPDEVHAVALRHTNAEGLTYVVLRLAGPGGVRRVGTESLTPSIRRRLEAGELWLEVFTRQQPFGSARARLVVPGSVGDMPLK